MAKIGGTCYVKVDGLQIELTGGIEVPMNTKVKEAVVGLSGSTNYKETHRAPFIKGTYAVPKDFPINKLMDSDDMTATAELANGWVYVLSDAFVVGECDLKADEGTVDIEFNGTEGFFQ
jgi:Phage tail tube protein.